MFPMSEVNSPLPSQYFSGASPQHRPIRNSFVPGPVGQFDLNGTNTGGGNSGSNGTGSAAGGGNSTPSTANGTGNNQPLPAAFGGNNNGTNPQQSTATNGNGLPNGTAIGPGGLLLGSRHIPFDRHHHGPPGVIGGGGLEFPGAAVGEVQRHHASQPHTLGGHTPGGSGNDDFGSSSSGIIGGGGGGGMLGTSLFRPQQQHTATPSGVGHGQQQQQQQQLGGHGVGSTTPHTTQYFPPQRYTRHVATPQRGSLLGSKAEIKNLEIRYDPPVENSVIQPYVTLHDEKGNTCFLADLGELKYRWYRGQKRQCANQGCNKGATMQCTVCLKLKMPQHLSFFCSSKCLQAVWPYYNQMYQQKLHDSPKDIPEPISWNDIDEIEGEDAWQFALSKGEHDVGMQANQGKTIDTLEALSRKFPPLISNIWAECGTQRMYSPQNDDIGRQLLLECVPIRHSAKGERGGSRNGGATSTEEVGNWVRKETSPVLQEPDPPPARRYVPNSHQRSNPSISSRDTFKTMCYNVLAESYATQQMYSYCPMRYLCWNYRRNIIMRDIAKYDCDIVCLQEVQQNHFNEFFQPEMSKHGYEGIYKMKTREPMGEEQVVDGCAVFYKKDRFAVMEQYAIEFNEAAKGSFENTPGNWQAKLRRLSKGNVALVCVLEELRSDGIGSRNRRKRRICVANTHIYWDPSFSDVKLWQTWILCQELQKMVLGRDLPLLLCGDFNSTPDSPVYELLSTERLRDDHDLLTGDEYGIFTQGELTHQLPLVSAYGSVFGAEPKYTNFTRQFSGCLDYIFYSKNHLQVTHVLDIDNDDVLKENTALPSPRFASDHIAIVAEFAFV